MTTVGDVVAALDDLYPPATAESWDAVGLVSGDPAASVRRVLFAVDPVQVVADEAVEWGADMIVVHHPLLLRPVHSVATSSHKGRVLHTLIKNDIALQVAHTNADSAANGVNDALAAALGVTNTTPLAPHQVHTGKLVVFVPELDAARVLDALAAAGAGVIGNYSRCAWTTSGVGTFHPGDAANPVIGRRGEVERVDETRLEMVVPKHKRSDVIAAVRASHPYEEPAFDLYELAPGDAPTGLGRVGTMDAPMPLKQFVKTVADRLPATAAGVRATGDADRMVETVAVCGGAGDSLLDAAQAAGADVYVTADLRHHPVSEALEAAGADGPAFVDVTHWASEWPWLALAATSLADKLREMEVEAPQGGGPPRAGGGSTVETCVSVTPTDPWTMHVASPVTRVTADDVRNDPDPTEGT